MSDARPNIIVVVSDTLRTAFLGCYGNDDIHTPHIDAFAADAALFEHAYPESLPTIPVRRTLHTGRRAYPFQDYRPLKWDIVYLPGWQPMSNDEDTVAENLVDAGYHTGFVSDTLPYFAPGLNFTRGFQQWEFVRGQQQDRWRAAASVSDEALSARYKLDTENAGHVEIVRQTFANVSWQRREEDTTTARTFQWAMDFATANRGAPFYLYIDCFDPHEPWEAPPEYYERYRPEGYDGPTIPIVPYGPYRDFCSEAELCSIVAHYKGLVTLVDEWFGRFLDRLRSLDLYDNTLIVFLSDHGTNFAENPEEVLGKPSWALYPGTMHLPLIVRPPGGEGAGSRIGGLTSNLDVPATVYDIADAKPRDGIHGQSLSPIIQGRAQSRWEYLTSRYDHTVWHFDGTRWVFAEMDGKRSAYRWEDGQLVEPDDSLREDDFALAWERILADAGGELPDYREHKRTDAVGQKRSDR